MVKFIIVLIASGVMVGFVSIAWSRFTVQPRPAPLQKVHDMVLKTQIGQNVADTLGVATPSAAIPISPGQIVQSVVQSVVTTVEHRTQEVVIENAVKQLSNQFNELPQDQKQQIQTIICKP